MQTTINNDQRVFIVSDSHSRQTFCNISELNAVCENLREDYFKIYYFENGKLTRATKKALLTFFEGSQIKQDFKY